MSAKPEAAAINLDEERLAHALVSRGLVSPEEIQQCRAGPKALAGPEPLLSRLTAAGFLTANQSRRALQEMTLLLGQQIPGYQLLDTLGEGSMGMVFKARQLSMNRLVAVKVLRPRLAASPGFLERFMREAHIVAKLSHNNIVQAIDVGAAGKIHYFVMEYVEGTTIKDELEGGKTYAEAEALEVVSQIAQALQHAHRRNLIHRDIKPSNIIITTEKTAKLADLGLARETVDHDQVKKERGGLFGTPDYIAPEQAQGRDDIDSRADIYSLGATFYHMVTGHRPFEAPTMDDMLRAHLEEELVPPDHLNTTLSAGLGEVIEFMMAKDRRKRYPTAGDLLIDLECLRAGKPPQLARERIAAATLKTLAEGDEEDDEESGPGQVPKNFMIAVYALIGLLAVSLLLNLVLLFVRP